MDIYKEINRALAQLERAEQSFDYAAPEFVEVAVAELAAAETKLDLLYRLAKKEGEKDGLNKTAATSKNSLLLALWKGINPEGHRENRLYKPPKTNMRVRGM